MIPFSEGDRSFPRARARRMARRAGAVLSSRGSLVVVRPLSLCYAETGMRRTIHIAVALVTVLLLVRPFECFAGNITQESADCCAKGKCHPGRNADDCCRNMTSADAQFAAFCPAQIHSVPAPDITVVSERPVLADSIFVGERFRYSNSSPPGSPPPLQRNLPLLI